MESVKRYNKDWYHNDCIVIRINLTSPPYGVVETNQLSQTASWVMYFTDGDKVLNPPELKDMVRHAAKEILKEN
ncbi:MAG: hypothetical protein II367_03580 [Treponema sp.]|nr:hypothetical protein [Treponema sp.]